MEDQTLFGDLVNESDVLGGINRLITAVDKFGDVAARQNERVLVSLQEVNKELIKYQGTIAAINVRTDAGKSQFGAIKTDAEAATKASDAFNTVINKNNGLIETNASVIQQLKQRMKELEAETNSLDTSTRKGTQRLNQIGREMGQLSRTTATLTKVTNTATRSIETHEDSYRALDAEVKRLKNDLKEMPGAFDRLTNKINVTNKAALDMQKRILAGSAALKTMDSQMGDNQRRVGTYGDALVNLSGQLTTATTAAGLLMLAYQGIKQALEITANMERLEAGLRAVSRDNEDFGRSQEFLIETADELGVRYDSLVKSFKLLKAATKDTSLEGATTEQIFHSIANAGARLQLSNEEVEGSLLALTQMISKGHIQAEELRGQLGERLPGALKIMALATGVSEQKLDDMMKKGQLLAVDVLPQFAKELDKIYGGDAQGKINTMTAGWNRMVNQAQLLVAAFNENKKVTTFFGTIQSGIADLLGDITALVKSDSWTSLFTGFGLILSGNFQAGADLISARGAAARAEQQKANAPLDRFRKSDALGRSAMLQEAGQAVSNAKSDLGRTSENDITAANLKRRAALQDEINKKTDFYNKLLTINKSIAEGADRKQTALTKEKAQADARAAEERKKQLTKEQQEAQRAANEAIGKARAGTEDKLTGLDLRKQTGAVSEKEYLDERLKITISGLDERAAILKRYGQQESDDFITVQREKKRAQLQYNADSLKLALDESKSRTVSKLSGVADDKAQGVLTEEEAVERKRTVTIAGIRERQRILQDAGLQESQAYKDTEREILEADKNYYNERLQVTQKGWDAELTIIKQKLQESDAMQAESLDNELADLREKYRQQALIVKMNVASGKITSEQGNAQLHAIQIAHIQEQTRAVERAYDAEERQDKSLIESKIANLEQFKQLETTTDKERIAADKDIAKLKDELDDKLYKKRKKRRQDEKKLENEGNEESDAAKLEAAEKKENKRRAIIEGSFQLIQNVGDAFYANDAIRLDDKMRALEKQKEFELSTVGDNEAAKAAIEKKYDDQRKQIQHQQDVQARERATFDAIVGTAVAVVKALPNPVTAAIAAALGLAQIAIINSAKYPEYAEGKNVDNLDSYAGLADVGEKGRELVAHENGDVKLYNQRTRIHVGRNTVVVPNHITEHLLNDERALDANRLLHGNQRSRALYEQSMLQQQRAHYPSRSSAQPAIDVRQQVSDYLSEKIEVHNLSFSNGELIDYIDKGATTIKTQRNSHQLNSKSKR